MLSLHRDDGTLLSSSYQICKPYLHRMHLTFLPPAQSTLPCALISFPSRLSKTLPVTVDAPSLTYTISCSISTDIRHKYMPPHLYALDSHLHLSSLALFSKLDPYVQRAEWHCHIRPLRYLQPNTNKTEQSPTTHPTGTCTTGNWDSSLTSSVTPAPSGPPSPSVVSCLSIFHVSPSSLVP